MAAWRVRAARTLDRARNRRHASAGALRRAGRLHGGGRRPPPRPVRGRRCRNLPDRRRAAGNAGARQAGRSEEHTSELQSLMRISYAVFCLKKKKHKKTHKNKKTLNKKKES